MKLSEIAKKGSPKAGMICHEDAKALHIGTLPDHAYFIPFTSPEGFSFNASEYTQEELAEKRHSFELEKSGFTVICADFKMAGVGSAACGPKLAEKYRLPLPKISGRISLGILACQ